MKRDQIMECFNAFFEKYPEKRLIYKNRLEEMEHISKQYLHEEDIEEWDKLPETLSAFELCKLDEKYNHTLKWKLIPTSLKEDDIIAFEKEMGLKLPVMFREYLLSYASLLNDIYVEFVGSIDYYAYTFNVETGKSEYLYEDPDDVSEKTAVVRFDFPYLLYGDELTVFKGEDYSLFTDFGYVYLGELAGNGQELLFLDCCTGMVVSFDHDGYNYEAESREELAEDAWPRFVSFDDFLYYILKKKKYDAEKEELRIMNLQL